MNPQYLTWYSFINQSTNQQTNRWITHPSITSPLYSYPLKKREREAHHTQTLTPSPRWTLSVTDERREEKREEEKKEEEKKEEEKREEWREEKKFDKKEEKKEEKKKKKKGKGDGTERDKVYVLLSFGCFFFLLINKKISFPKNIVSFFFFRCSQKNPYVQILDAEIEKYFLFILIYYPFF